MRLLSTIASSFYWTTAQEVDGAVNGFTLTEGNFRREAQIEFATGLYQEQNVEYSRDA